MQSDVSSRTIAVECLIRELSETIDPWRLEAIADALDAEHDRRAIAPLLRRLGSRVVQRNERVEDAFCAALAGLGVMRTTRAGRYVFAPQHQLEPDVIEMLSDLGSATPLRYFVTSPGR
jgi:hypothetical protein